MPVLCSPGPNSATINAIVDANLNTQLPLWLANISNISSALSALQAVRDARTLTTVADQAEVLYNSVQPSSPLQKQTLPDALQALTALRQALSLASPALACASRFVNALRHINDTLVAFPPGPAAIALANFSAAQAALQQLTGAPSSSNASIPDAAMLDHLLQSLQDLPPKLQGAPDPTEFATNARAADSTLQQLPDPRILSQQISQVRRKIQQRRQAGHLRSGSTYATSCIVFTALTHCMHSMVHNAFQLAGAGRRQCCAACQQ